MTPCRRCSRQHFHSRQGGVMSLVVILLVLSGAGFAAWTVYGSQLFGSGTKTTYLTEMVKRGPLEVTITERGNIDSAANVTLTNRVEGSTTIIKIVAEGTKAKVGDVLVELDSAALRDKETQQRIDLEQADAALKQAIEKKAIQVTQNESDIRAAELKLTLAQLDLEQYQKGDYPKELNDLNGKKILAQEELKRAQESYDFSKRNSNKGYVSQSALEAARIAVTQKQLSLNVAEEAVNVLTDYIFKRQIAEKDANAKEFVSELERVKRKASAALSQAEADESASKLRAAVEKSKLDKLREQISYCVIVAPQDGEVVYANFNSSDRRGGNDQVLIQEGAQVRERQAIINLPDYTKMQVNARIHESRIGFVRPNLRAIVRTDATPGIQFNGIIETISSVPLSGGWPNRDLKEYATTVRLTDDIETLRKLKPGLSAEVEIKVDFIASCLQVPVQAIITIGRYQYAFPVINGTPEVRKVEIGKTNDIMVEIKGGLKEGEGVLLNPRSIMGKEISKLEDQYREEEDQQRADDVKHGKVPAIPGTGGPVPGASPGQAGPNPGGPAAGGPGAAAGTGGPGAPTAGGPSGGGSGASGGGDPAAFFARLDANGDGKFTADEAADERAKGMLTRMDKNGDGAVDLEEFKAGAVGMRRPGGGAQGAGAPMGAGVRGAGGGAS